MQFFATQAVGGVSIDANGVLNKAKPDDLSSAEQWLGQQMQQIPAGLNQNVRNAENLAAANRGGARRLHEEQ